MLLPNVIVAKSTVTLTAQRDSTLTSWTGVTVTFNAKCNSTGTVTPFALTVSQDGNSASYTTNAATDFQTSGSYIGQIVTSQSGANLRRSAPFNFTVLPAI